MVARRQHKTFVTPEEYLERERTAEFKSSRAVRHPRKPTTHRLLGALLGPSRRIAWRVHQMEAQKGGAIRILRRRTPCGGKNRLVRVS